MLGTKTRKREENEEEREDTKREKERKRRPPTITAAEAGRPKERKKEIERSVGFLVLRAVPVGNFP